jgi:hypothetical protein
MSQLAETLATLKAADVVSAELDASGNLLRVTFMPTVEMPADEDNSTPTTRGLKGAAKVLSMGGSRPK